MFKRKEKLKGPGFYQPMDLVPDEYGSVINYPALKELILDAMNRDWGPRCETKDYVEYPDMLLDDKWGRCPVCLVYEKFDEFWEKLCPE